MSLELVLLQGLNIKNEGIIEAIDTCEHALYSLPFDPNTMRIIPSMDDPSKPLFKPFVCPEYQKHVDEIMSMKNLSAEYNPDPYATLSNPYGGYEPVSYPALSQPIIPKPIIPETITPMSAISTPSFMKPITSSIFESKGLIDSQPFQFGYNFPETKTQMHFHGPDKNIITEGRILDYNHNILKKEISGYDASMAALRADLFGFKKFP